MCEEEREKVPGKKEREMTDASGTDGRLMMICESSLGSTKIRRESRDRDTIHRLEPETTLLLLLETERGWKKREGNIPIIPASRDDEERDRQE